LECSAVIANKLEPRVVQHIPGVFSDWRDTDWVSDTDTDT